MNVQKITNKSKKVFKCQICCKIITYSGRGRFPKYCNKCAYFVKLSQIKRVKRKKLSDSELSEHFCGDFNKEEELMKKEIEKIGFKRQFS